jgi:excisionase family DNA binding protein
MCHPLLNDIKHQLDHVLNLVESIKTGTKYYLSLEEAARYLNIAKSTLYKKTALGEITFYKPAGKLILFRRDDLEAWIEKTRIPSNEELSNIPNSKS